MSSYIICTSRPGKSIPNYFFAFAEGLVNKGNQVILVCDLKYNKETSRNGIEITHWPNDRPTKLNDALFFLKLCRSFKPDVVLGQFGSKIITMSISKFLGIRNRVIYHHTLSDQLRHDLGKINRKNQFIQNIVYNKFSTLVIANSRATKEDVENTYSLNTGMTHVLPYLLKDVNRNESIRTKENRKEEILFVSRIDPSKGHSLIIEQISSVLQKFPKLQFTFIGKGSEIKSLQARCIELGIDKSVNFLGFVKPLEVYEYMKSALIHISASRAEAFGLVNIEALCCGTPILGPKTGGIADIIKDGESGYFYDPEDFGDLGEKIEKVFSNWEEHSIKARKYFDDYYSIENSKTVSNQIEEFESFLH